MSVFNPSRVDVLSQPMFFGSELNVQRNDKSKYPIFERINKKMISLFWIPEEISLQKDRNDYQKLTPFIERLFTRTIRYQILLDSVQSRSILQALGPVVSDPALEGCLTTWQFFEEIHNRSYSHILKNVVRDTDEIYDGVLEDELIVKRATSVTKYYDDYIAHLHMFKAQTEFAKHGCDIPDMSLVSEYELKKKLFLVVAAVAAMESVRFYSSFLTTWGIAQGMKLMNSTAQIISLIARDEKQHVGLTSNILKNWRSGAEGREWFEISLECADEFTSIFADTLAEEKEWATSLFSGGSMIGLSAEMVHAYLDFLTHKRMKNFGLTPIVARRDNPLNWVADWEDGSKQQSAPQEIEIIDYEVGQTVNDVSEDTFAGLDLGLTL